MQLHDTLPPTINMGGGFLKLGSILGGPSNEETTYSGSISGSPCVVSAKS